MVCDVTEFHRLQAASIAREDYYRQVLEMNGLLNWIAAADGAMTHIGTRWLERIDLSRDEAFGQGWTRALHPEDHGATAGAWARARLEGEPFEVEHRIRHAGGEYRWMRSRACPRHDSSGEIVCWYGTSEDIHERKLAEADLQAAVASRDLYLREQNHRINNSLALVAAVLQRQLAGLSDPMARAALDDAVSRILTVAQVHRALQQSADVSRIPAGSMLRELCAQFSQLNPCITIQCSVTGDVVLDSDRAMPLALIVSEALINALKYAYPASQSGTIRVTASADAGGFVIAIADQGVGLAAGAASASSFGTKIVSSLCRQIGAVLHVQTARHEGTVVSLSLPVNDQPCWASKPYEQWSQSRRQV